MPKIVSCFPKIVSRFDTVQNMLTTLQNRDMLHKSCHDSKFFPNLQFWVNVQQNIWTQIWFSSFNGHFHFKKEINLLNIIILFKWRRLIVELGPPSLSWTQSPNWHTISPRLCCYVPASHSSKVNKLILKCKVSDLKKNMCL